MTHLFLLLGAGLVAGFIAGLIGVGGGVIFAPVLFFYYQAIGVAPEILAPLTIGSSLFCTLLAALASAATQYQKKAVVTRIAVAVGLSSAVVVFLMTQFVTTQPWYDGTVFQVVFSIVLLSVVGRMLFKRGESETSGDANDQTPVSADQSWLALGGAGTIAGAVSSAAGVGGGVVLVPAYIQFMGLPMRLASGTSSATIVLISSVGVIVYALQGLGETAMFGAVGYVDAVRALLLAVPSLFTANIGVHVAHRINQRALRLSFAGIAAVVAIRLLYGAFA